jgi:hypothetical protein
MPEPTPADYQRAARMVATLCIWSPYAEPMRYEMTRILAAQLAGERLSHPDLRPADAAPVLVWTED